MAATIIDWTACISKLEAENPGGFFKTIQVAMEQDIPENSGELPAVYITPGVTDADPMDSGASRQQVHPSIEVNLLVHMDQLQEAIGHLHDILLGWEMDPEHGPFRLATTGYLQSQAAMPVALQGGVIWWKERLQNTTHTKRIHYNT